MRRSRRLVALFAGLVFTLLVLPSASLAATPTTTTPAIKLACALVIPAPASSQPRIVCRWSAFDGAVQAYRLWRRVDLGSAHLIAAVMPGQELRHADPNIRAGHTYSYRVAAVANDGSRLGGSALVSVHVGRAPEALKFNCFFIIDDATQGAECHWSASTRPGAVRYALYRSVDDGARELVYRTPLNGRRSFLDVNVKAGQTVRYAVVALAADGRIVGIGGPDAVKIPEVTFTASAR